MINFPIISDPRGNLTFIESKTHIPFEIKRVFWIYDVPGGEIRGGHAYRTNEEVIIALSGSFDVVVSKNEKTVKYTLNRSYSGLYMPALTWRHLENFSTNALALIISSKIFSEDDYLREKKSYNNLKMQTIQETRLLSENKNQKIVQFNSKKTLISDCKLINLGIKHNDKGNITVLENFKNHF